MSDYLALDDWIATIEGEYLAGFVPGGGAAVKFAVAPLPATAEAIRGDLERAARAAGCQFAHVDAAATKIHMIHELFFAVARQIDWDALVGRFARSLLERNGFRVPSVNGSVPTAEAPAVFGGLDYRTIAEHNGYDEVELRRDVRLLLTEHVYRDFAMAQEFRIAMMRLCQARFEPSASGRDEADAIKRWLRGELRMISALKSALIFQKIQRHNARDMLMSGRYDAGLRPINAATVSR